MLQNSNVHQRSGLSVWTQPVLKSISISEITANGNGSGTDGDPVVGMMMVSDVRQKFDVNDIGSSANGLKLYSFRYNSTPDKQWVGAMAQDLLSTHPDAVCIGDDGFYRVDYSKLGFEMQSLEDWHYQKVLPRLKKHQLN